MSIPRKAKPANENESDNLAMEKAMERIQNEILETKANTETEPVAAIPVDEVLPIRNATHIIQVDCRPIPDSQLKELGEQIRSLIGKTGEVSVITGNQPIVIIHAYNRNDALQMLRLSQLLRLYAIEILISELGKVGIPTVREKF